MIQLEKKQVFFAFPQIRIQLISINPYIITDGKHALDIQKENIPQEFQQPIFHSKINKIDGLFLLKEWEFNFYFDKRSHYLSFDMKIYDMEFIEMIENKPQQFSKLIQSPEFKMEMEILRKHHFKIEFREKDNVTNLQPLVYEEFIEVKQISQQQTNISAIFNKNQKFGIASQKSNNNNNSSLSFNFQKDIKHIPNQKLLNVQSSFSKPSSYQQQRVNQQETQYLNHKIEKMYDLQQIQQNQNSQINSDSSNSQQIIDQKKKYNEIDPGYDYDQNILTEKNQSLKEIQRKEKKVSIEKQEKSIVNQQTKNIEQQLSNNDQQLNDNQQQLFEDLVIQESQKKDQIQKKNWLIESSQSLELDLEIDKKISDKKNLQLVKISENKNSQSLQKKKYDNDSLNSSLEIVENKKQIQTIHLDENESSMQLLNLVLKQKIQPKSIKNKKGILNFFFNNQRKDYCQFVPIKDIQKKIKQNQRKVEMIDIDYSSSSSEDLIEIIIPFQKKKKYY